MKCHCPVNWKFSLLFCLVNLHLSSSSPKTRLSVTLIQLQRTRKGVLGILTLKITDIKLMENWGVTARNKKNTFWSKSIKQAVLCNKKMWEFPFRVTHKNWDVHRFTDTLVHQVLLSFLIKMLQKFVFLFFPYLGMLSHIPGISIHWVLWATQTGSFLQRSGALGWYAIISSMWRGNWCQSAS